MAERIVTVWGKRYTIIVEQKSKSVWVAAGEYKGELHLVKDRTPGAAAKRWVEWATYKDN